MFLFWLLIITFVLVVFFLVIAAENKKKYEVEKKQEEEVVYVNTSWFEKFMDKNLVDEEVLMSIKSAKEHGLDEVGITKKKYNYIQNESLRLLNKKEYSQPKAEEPIKCPKCHSTQITAEKKGYSAGKALAGALVTGGIGLLAGFHGAGNIKVICLKCGNSWTPKG